MEYNLLSSLRKYRPRENQDPLENFVTEAFAWLLKNNKDFSNFFLKKILMRLPAYSGLVLQTSLDCRWTTQMNFGGIFPDMVAEFNDGALLVFEHKVWAPLHPGQLDGYKKFSSANYSGSHLILITANESQHLQDPDLALCWRDIYAWIQEWIQSDEHEKTGFIFFDFLNLLKEEGLGPIAPVSHDAILSYYSARGFRDQLVNLIRQAEKRDWSYINPQISVNGFKKANGKIFYELSGRLGLLLFEDGCPSLTTGFILDWENYHIPPILRMRSPDFSVMLRFTDFQNEYSETRVYQEFSRVLREKIELLGDDWMFYDHINDPQAIEKNKGFPIHIRKPMLDLLRGTTSSEEQVSRFMQANELVLKAILNCQEFFQMREFFAQKIGHDSM